MTKDEPDPILEAPFLSAASVALAGDVPSAKPDEIS